MYGTAAGFTEYHEARGRSVAEWEEPEINAQLLVASEWLDNTFRDKFDGWKVAPTTQEREWPRTGVVDFYGYAVSSASVPVQIERATYEAALRLLTDPDMLSRDVAPTPYKRVSIDGALSVEYAGQAAASLATHIPIIGQVLSSLLNWRGVATSATSGRVVRG